MNMYGQVAGAAKRFESAYVGDERATAAPRMDMVRVLRVAGAHAFDLGLAPVGQRGLRRGVRGESGPALAAPACERRALHRAITDCAMRFAATSQYRSSISMPMALRPKSFAARRVL